jgi:hypothetical protein
VVSRTARAVVAATLAVALLGACTDSPDDADPAATNALADVSTTTTDADEVTATTEASTSTTGATASDLVLRGDGLGLVALGADPAEAMAAVVAALGDPSADSGWQPAGSSPYGTCPGTEVRGVEWGHLVLLFTDGATAHGSGPHLFAWRISGSPPALGTANGFGYQATVVDAEELYPGAVEVVPADEPFPGFLRVAADGGTITAYLDEADVVTNLEAGAACGE